MKIKIKNIIFLLILITLTFSGCNRDNFDAIDIKLDEDGITIKAEDIVELDENEIIITQGGEYRFTGVGYDVQIEVDCIEPVTIILDEVEITNEKKIPIKIKSNGSVTINSVGDKANTIQITQGDKNPCIKADGVLSIIGDNQLQLAGPNGIKAEKLQIYDAWLNIKQDNTGIKADSVDIHESIIDIESPYDGAFGIYANESIVTLHSDLMIVSTKDCLHSEDSIHIDGGLITMATYDDAIHADNHVEIISGTINITNSLEGIESKRIDIYGGKIDITSDNDGINAVSDDEKECANIYINGGKIIINADGDGLDANGSIYMNGGLLFVSGAYGGDNNAIDFDDEFIINGGVVMAAGNNLKAKPASQDSLQNSAMLIFDEVQRGDMGFVLVDTDGNVMFAADFHKPYDCMIISFAELEIGKQYQYGETMAVANDYKYPIIDTQVNYEITKNSQFKITSNVTLVRH